MQGATASRFRVPTGKPRIFTDRNGTELRINYFTGRDLLPKGKRQTANRQPPTSNMGKHPSSAARRRGEEDIVAEFSSNNSPPRVLCVRVLTCHLVGLFRVNANSPHSGAGV
ncbi:hypothetical protein ACO22_06659 [Paracoccidioides brasiliensis]|uniref:Uncharacterized protein n=1 Tax=Paracoccidioides brasiliensis TaxID=121759 RepID=A0A1D2J6T5_PARBR|nr:hypothetical protein ACO22_06659 [Paracoccidioides brasiliensis]